MEKVIVIDGEQISVDQHCADLVLFFNEIGMKTTMCCQGHEKPIYRIWFDVEDGVVEEFVRKTWTEWTNTGWNFTNDENTEYELTEYPRGINGWIYKKLWFSNGQLKREWVYQSEGPDNESAIKNAYGDLEILKALYFGGNLEKLKKKEKEKKLTMLERCVERNHRLAQGSN